MIELDNVSFTYREEDNNGVRGINLQIKSGQCVLLCGRSGCGKTTVTRLINGLIPHFYNGELEGHVRVATMDIAHTPMYEIAAKVGSVFQNPHSQFFNVDTDSEIAFGIENLAYAPEEIRKIVDKTARDLQLEGLLRRSIFKLSGGERQKIAFASVYALSPDVYVLDEPSSNLDAQAIEELRNLLLLLRRQGKTIVIAEHRVYYLQAIADRILYMEQGQIVAEYTPEEFRQLDFSQRSAQGLRAMDLKQIDLSLAHRTLGDPILEINNLGLSYGKTKIGRNISLEASTGEVIGIIGSNGAGKSTFSQTLCGLRQEYAGNFRWQGKLFKVNERLKLSYLVMQDVNYQLFAESVEEECYIGCQRADRKKASQVLKNLALYDYRHRHPMSLSGGQKQRTAIAVSMLCNKDILIFDEPTSGLDLDSMLQVGRLIGELADQGKIVVVVTHDYELMMTICSRIVWMEKGGIKDIFPVEDRSVHKLQGYFVPD